MFHVPVEERRYNVDDRSFGDVTSSIVRDITERTKCDVEISQSKDHSLTIMVTGKQTAVLGARKEILGKLQTQVCIPHRCIKVVCTCIIAYVHVHIFVVL